MFGCGNNKKTMKTSDWATYINGLLLTRGVSNPGCTSMGQHVARRAGQAGLFIRAHPRLLSAPPRLCFLHLIHLRQTPQPPRSRSLCTPHFSTNFHHHHRTQHRRRLNLRSLHHCKHLFEIHLIFHLFLAKWVVRAENTMPTPTEAGVRTVRRSLGQM
jgi:hypothetical protein